MYNIYNASEIFYIYDIQRERTSLIGNKQDFINFLARGYNNEIFLDGHTICVGNKYTNKYLKYFACSQGDVDELTRWQFFDGCGRCINPKIYEREAYDLFLRKYLNMVRYNPKKWHKNKVYKGIFRQTPVGSTSNTNYRYRVRRKPHYRSKIEDFLIPEYRKYKRGDYISGWDYSENLRHVEKNWKKQGKRRHQWERG